MSKTSKLLGDNIPFVEAAHRGGKQKPTAVVLRSSWTTSDKGAALAIAKAWHYPNSRVDSCHYVVDDGQTIRCIPDDLASRYGLESAKGALSINVCYDPPDFPTTQVLVRTAQLTARLCKLYNLPVRIMTQEDRRLWLKHRWKRRGGIMLHTPSRFPEDEFMAAVVEHYNSF